MKRILFVDDEPRVLSGLRRMLASYRKEWDMHFVGSGQEALEKLASAEEPFDVIVSDVRMPRMNGVELLEKVRDLYPSTVRIILSGDADAEMTLEAAKQSHQYMSKPCNPELLRERIQRCCNVRDLLTSDVLKSLLSEIKSLPSLPTLYAQVEREIQSDGSMEAIGKIIAQDVSMSAKVIQLVNSAFFGLPQKITAPERAAAFLGFSTIRSLVLSIEVFSRFPSSGVSQAELSRLWNHSFAAGNFARAIAKTQNAGSEEVEHSFLAGLLHDSGKMVLAAHLPEEAKKVRYLVKKGMPHIAAEKAVLQTTHAEIGAYLYGIWGLPEAVVEAIAFHHSPELLQGDCSPLVIAVYAAENICRVFEEGVAVEEAFDLQFMESIGLADRIESWIEICRGISEGEGAAA